MRRRLDNSPSGTSGTILGQVNSVTYLTIQNPGTQNSTAVLVIFYFCAFRSSSLHAIGQMFAEQSFDFGNDGLWAAAVRGAVLLGETPRGRAELQERLCGDPDPDDGA